MTDDPTPTQPQSSNGAGDSRAGRTAVRSGLAHRRNPVLAALGEFAGGTRRVLLRDPLSLFLLLASIGLAIAFATLLGAIKPGSSGLQVPLSTVQTLAKRHDIQSATVLDHDARVELTTAAIAPAVLANGVIAGTSTEASAGEAVATTAATGLQRLWAAYPASGAITQQLLKELSASGAIVSVNQESGKGTEAIVVQFLIPILLLVCLFSLFTRMGADGAAGGIAAFSQFTGKGRKRGKGTADKITFADVAGAGEALAELREIR
ncbi:MAG TPA: hypothetical protein VJ996_07895, partial [Solirubrobacteraceae bacterium]|nr:hypothetical protein [Solirubrobacteraceae bacterium]